MTYDTIAIPGGFIKLMRSEATRELLKDPKAFNLLTTIALRAKRRHDFNIHDLRPGQALIGDHASCGLSEQEYRRAKIRLQRYGLARFEGTSKGTIATLCNTVIYDINVTTSEQAENERGTDGERTGNDQGTTIKKEKKVKKEKNTTSLGAMGIARKLAELLWELIRQRKADFRQPDLDRWARDIERMIRLDRRDPQRIEAVLRWCQADPFWQSNILSGAALRRHFDRLELKMRSQPARESTAEQFERMEREGLL